MTIELEVDLDGLYDMAGRLKGLQEEFERADDVAEDSGVCFPELQQAMHQFAANWSDKRRKIGEMIDDVAGCVENTGRVYHEVERTIAGGFATSGGTSAS